MPASFVLCVNELSGEQLSDVTSQFSDLVIVPVTAPAVPFSGLRWV